MVSQFPHPVRAPRNVAIGLVWHGRRLLVIRRPPNGPLPGLWEFPGGKLEAGETPEAALRRELREEVGLAVMNCLLLPALQHEYAHITVRLHPLMAESATPVVRLNGPTAARWVTPAELSSLPFLPGSRRLQRLAAFLVR